MIEIWAAVGAVIVTSSVSGLIFFKLGIRDGYKNCMKDLQNDLFDQIAKVLAEPDDNN